MSQVVSTEEWAKGVARDVRLGREVTLENATHALTILEVQPREIRNAHTLALMREYVLQGRKSEREEILRRG